MSIYLLKCSFDKIFVCAIKIFLDNTVFNQKRYSKKCSITKTTESLDKFCPPFNYKFWMLVYIFRSDFYTATVRYMNNFINIRFSGCVFWLSI